MVYLIIDVASWFLIAVGSVSILIGGIGVLRLPDVYTRMHAASITDTLGSAALLFALMLQAGPTLVAAKLALILVFIFLTSPTSSFALSHGALGADVQPELKNDWREGIPADVQAEADKENSS